MKGTILLNYDENLKYVEEEERTRFLYCLLEQMGVPINEFWNVDDTLSVNQKIKLRNILVNYGVQILDDYEGRLEVYFSDDSGPVLVGTWNKCTYKIKKNIGSLDPRKKLYFEMYIDYWSMFEDAPSSENGI